MNGNVLQRNISKVFPNKITATAVEILFLLLMGTIAMLIHAKLKIPMHLPGKNGILFMAIIISAKASSRFTFAISIACLGSASIFLFSNLGFSDPFMPVVYILLGIIMDLLFSAVNKINSNVFLVALASGLSWMFIPIIRFIISTITGFPYESIISGIAYPLTSHFVFGFLGGIIGAGLIYLADKSK